VLLQMIAVRVPAGNLDEKELATHADLLSDRLQPRDRAQLVVEPAVRIERRGETGCRRQRRAQQVRSLLGAGHRRGGLRLQRM